MQRECGNCRVTFESPLLGGFDLCVACRRQELILERQTQISQDTSDRMAAVYEEYNAELLERHEAELARLEELDAARERDAEEYLEALERNTNQQREDLANAWKIQAEARRVEGARLVGLGLTPDGIKLLQQSANEHPGNIQTWVHLAAAFGSLGNHKDRQHAIGQQIRLLSNSPLRDFRPAIEQLRAEDDKQLVLLKSVLASKSPTTTIQDANSIVGLVRIGLRSEAEALAAKLLAQSSTLAHILLFHWVRGTRSAEGFAITVRSHLQTYQVATRDELYMDYIEAKNFISTFTGELDSAEELRETLRVECGRHYQTMIPEVDAELVRKATEQKIDYKLDISISNKAFKFAIAIAVFSYFFILFSPSVVKAIVPSFANAPGWVSLLFFPMMYIGPIIVFFLAKASMIASMKSSAVESMRQTSLNTYRRDELQMWDSLCRPGSGHI